MSRKTIRRYLWDLDRRKISEESKIYGSGTKVSDE